MGLKGPATDYIGRCQQNVARHKTLVADSFADCEGYMSVRPYNVRVRCALVCVCVRACVRACVCVGVRDCAFVRMHAYNMAAATHGIQK